MSQMPSKPIKNQNTLGTTKITKITLNLQNYQNNTEISKMRKVTRKLLRGCIFRGFVEVAVYFYNFGGSKVVWCFQVLWSLLGFQMYFSHLEIFKGILVILEFRVFFFFLKHECFGHFMGSRAIWVILRA